MDNQNQDDQDKVESILKEIKPDLTQPSLTPRKSSKKPIYIILAVIIVLGALSYGFLHYHKPKKAVELSTSSTSTKTPETNVKGLQLNANKNYGNKYKAGVLPVGDGKYTTSAPKKGYVYACSGY